MPGSDPRYELLNRRLLRFTRALEGVEKGRVRSVHRARVASRRLREVLPVLQLDSDVARHLGRRLRKVTHRLGTVRELDVMVQMVEELQGSGRYEERACAQLASAVSLERSSARDRLLSRLPIAELLRLASKLDKIADTLAEKDQGNRRAWRWAIDAKVTHRAGTLKAAIEEAGSVYLPHRIHLARIAIKKFRYAVELQAELAPDKDWSQELMILIGRCSSSGRGECRHP
jgi:CHAD domain-containing protein